MTNHKLKCWPEQFERVVGGLKRHEVREADRDFKSGDSVTLEEWKPEDRADAHGPGAYTGRTSAWIIGHITEPGTFGMPAGVCSFSLLTELRPEQADLLRKPICIGCHKSPYEIEEYVEAAADEGMTPDAYVRSEEGTYNPENHHFLCTGCYVARGMPSSDRGWLAP